MHYIPVNVIDNGCIGGTHIKTRNAVEAGAIALGMFLLMKIFLFAVPVLIWTILFFLFGLFPGLIALIGIGNQSLSEALRTYLSYRRSKELLPYSMAALLPEEEKPAKRHGKEERKKKMRKKRRRADEK